MEIRERRQLESNCLLSFRVCKTIYEDETTLTVTYGLQGVDQQGNVQFHIREISDSYFRVKKLTERLNSRIFSQIHLLDMIEEYLAEG